MTTVFKEKPIIGLVELESWSDNDNYVEKHDGEQTHLYADSYVSGISISVQTTYLYKSGRTSSHYNNVDLTADQARLLAKKLNEIADKQDARS